MKKIKTMSDISLILTFKCDVKDNMGHTIPFVRFVSMKLVDIVNDVIGSGEWTYSVE